MADFRHTFDVIDGIRTYAVSSSNLESIGYDDANETMIVSFLSGAAYRYSDVPEGVFLGLMKASSHGQFFWANVRLAGYDYERIRGPRSGAKRGQGEPLWPKLGRTARRIGAAISDLTGTKPAGWAKPTTPLGSIVAGLIRRK